MIVVQADGAGGVDVLRVVEKPTPTPGPGQVLIRHKAVGLNFIDIYQRTGLYPVTYPAVLGSEASGIVEAVGGGVTRFRVGDRAAYAGVGGAYAEANLIPEGRAVHVPDGVSLETAAAAMLKGMTAEFLIRRCYPVKAGEAVLVHAAAGGMGQILVQWIKALDGVVIATAGGPEKLALARSLGADHGIDYRTEDVAKRVHEITAGAGVAVAYDSVGAATFEGTLGAMARRGTIVSFGNASGPPSPIAPARLAQAGSLYLTRPTLAHYIATTEELDVSANALFEVIQSGIVKIDIGQTFALRDARGAHAALEGRTTTGSTLLLP